jgi:AcrR family transcriptional regulator
MAGKGTSGRGRKAGAETTQPARHEEPALSRERVIAAAVDLLDADGIEGLTMRRLADRLGCGVMSLYWHVDNKDAVFDLALDSVLAYGGAAQPAASGDWRSEILHLLEDWRANMLRHPWSAALLPRRALGRSMLYRLELLSRILANAGVREADLNPAIWSLWNYVMGATITRASLERSDAERTAAQERLAQTREHFPTIERSRLLLDDDWEGAFRKGLGFLMAGFGPR